MRITFVVPDSKAPSLRAAVDELSATLANRLSGQFPFPAEAAFTDAAIGVGALRAAICQKVPRTDDQYIIPRRKQS